MCEYLIRLGHDGEQLLYKTIPNGIRSVTFQTAKNTLNKQAKRITELEARSQENWTTALKQLNRAEAAETTIKAIGELPDRWNKGSVYIEADGSISHVPKQGKDCAYELQALLKHYSNTTQTGAGMMNLNELAKLLPGGLADLKKLAHEIDKANPELRKAFENQPKDKVYDDDLDELVEEIEEIFEHNGKPDQ